MNTSNTNSVDGAGDIQDNFKYFLNQAHSPFAILTGRNFVFTFANNAYKQLMSGRQLVGKSLEEAIPELKGQAFISLLENVFDTSIPYHSPEIAATAVFSGDTEPTTRYFDLTYTPYKNTSGVTEGVMASGFDVTEQVELRKKENAQILNKQAYNLFMQAPVGFSLVTGDDHVLKLANETGLKLAGKGPGIIGKTISEIFPGIGSQGYIELLDRVKQTGEFINLKESPVTLIKNGKEETMYVNLIYQPYYEGDNIAGVLSISTDVTESVLAKKEAEELRERFETMANNIPNLAWIANADGWIFWYNSRWYEYTGTTPKDMEGWGWKSVHDPEKLPAVLEEWQQSINSGHSFEMVFPLLGADKVFRPFLTRVVPVHDNEGKVIRWLGTNTDITKQKEIEQIKDNFLSTASHELKTPVTTIKAYAHIVESMLDPNTNPEVLGMVKKLNSQVDRLTNLIEDLLDISKIQNGKLQYDESFYDFNKLVKEVVDDMQKTNITHEIIYDACTEAAVFGDRNKLTQVVSNLISNAIKYSPKGDKIIITTQAKDRGVLLSVKDFGIGIPKEELQHVFEQFYRVSMNDKITFPGMGIGLFISSEIIKRQGGKIWVESIPGAGSVFHTWLPFNYRSH
ncbi:MAG: PAS domain-containing protein [Bacteroidota bacterium]|nr:PAS domain-containing protein [Bacteroidota bacterium]